MDFYFLFVVAFEFSTSAREEATAAQRFSDETLGYYLALAGFERGLYDFLNQQSPAAQTAQALEAKKNDPFDGEFQRRRSRHGAFRVRLVDESGKININRVNDETLCGASSRTSVSMRPGRDILVDSIMDWRDADDLHRTNGAENDYYASLSPPYSAKNGPLDSVEGSALDQGNDAGAFLWLQRRNQPGGRRISADRFARNFHRR